MKWFDYTALTLVIIGALNWLLVGIFRFDLVAFLFGNLSWLSRFLWKDQRDVRIEMFIDIKSLPTPKHKEQGRLFYLRIPQYTSALRRSLKRFQL